MNKYTAQQLDEELKNLTTPKVKMPKIYSFDQVQQIIWGVRKEVIEEITKELKTGMWPMILRNNVTDLIEADRVRKIRVIMRNEIINYLSQLKQKKGGENDTL